VKKGKFLKIYFSKYGQFDEISTSKLPNPLYLKIMQVLSDADQKRKDSLACQNELLEMPVNF